MDIGTMSFIGFSPSTCSRYSFIMRLVFLLLLLGVASALLLFARRLGDAQLVQIVLQPVVARRRRAAPACAPWLTRFTLLPPAMISCRPCSSYHLVSVAVMCIFSMMLRQPTPVLYAQKEISPSCVAYGMMHCSVRRKS